MQDEGRYVLWLGDDDGDVVRCVERLGGDRLLIMKDNPTGHRTKRLLVHQEDDIYEEDDGATVRVRIRGQVVYPADTAHSILNTVTEQLSKVLNR